MSRLPRLLLTIALATTVIGCQYGRKFTAQRDKPANAVMLEDYEAKAPTTRDAAAAKSASRSKRNFATGDARGVLSVEPQSGPQRSGASQNRPAHAGRSPVVQRADDSRVADSRANERSRTATDTKPRNGWASMLNPFQPAKAIPVPRNDLTEPVDARAAEETSPASVEDDFDLFDGF